MDIWLRCKIGRGQFTEEFAIEGRSVDERGFSLFAQGDDLEFEGMPPTGDQFIDGWIRVRKIDERDDLVLIELPEQTLENGRTVTVKRDWLRLADSYQEA